MDNVNWVQAVVTAVLVVAAIVVVNILKKYF